MEQYSQSIIAMLAVINPVVCGAMLLQIQEGKDLKSNIRAAIKAMSIVLVILLFMAFGGKYVLQMFGISMDAFKVVGGIIIGFIGIQMMFNLTSNTNDANGDGDLSRLVIFAASPGTIAMIITLAAVNNGDGIPLVAIVGAVVAVLVSLMIIIGMLKVAAKKNRNKHGFITKFMGLIIVAMGLQFMLDGIKDFFGL